MSRKKGHAKIQTVLENPDAGKLKLRPSEVRGTKSLTRIASRTYGGVDFATAYKRWEGETKEILDAVISSPIQNAMANCVQADLYAVRLSNNRPDVRKVVFKESNGGIVGKVKGLLGMNRIIRSAICPDYKVLKGLTGNALKEAMNMGFVSSNSVQVDLREDTSFEGTAADTTTPYVPLMNGTAYRQMQLVDYQRQAAWCFEHFHHGLANRIVNILMEYIFGKRIVVQFSGPSSEKLSAVWKEFVLRNKYDWQLRNGFRDGIISGEILPRFYNGPGGLSMRNIDPTSIVEIVGDPEDAMTRYYFHQQYTTEFIGQYGKVPGGKSQSFVIRQIPDSECLYTALNSTSWERRGRSILFPSVADLKRFRDFKNAQVLKAEAEASYIWDDTVDGTADEVNTHADAYKNKPKHGSVFVHNKFIERKAMASGVSSGSGASQIWQDFLGFIATSQGIPREFLNIGGVGSRVEGMMRNEPFVKRIEYLRSSFVEPLIRETVARVAINAGIYFEEEDVEVMFPAIVKDLISERQKQLDWLLSKKVITHRRMAEMAAADMEISSYRYESEQNDRQKEEEKSIESSLINDPESIVDKPVDDVPAQDEQPDESQLHGEGKEKLMKGMKK